ncbi:hypothetical protein CSUB01_00999 [Colletotrichum sublineola]|uniref:Uncharacterized protein n=1 Tax=Colletotrichum sublineola TaxID=1173701 RepID=A0A066WZY2_COLSU|nr:hypothetical protein CSUB01_00999 [Colletotrichum sublineola]
MRARIMAFHPPPPSGYSSVCFSGSLVTWKRVKAVFTWCQEPDDAELLGPTMRCTAPALSRSLSLPLALSRSPSLSPARSGTHSTDLQTHRRSVAYNRGLGLFSTQTPGLCFERRRDNRHPGDVDGAMTRRQCIGKEWHTNVPAPCCRLPAPNWDPLRSAPARDDYLRQQHSEATTRSPLSGLGGEEWPVLINARLDHSYPGSFQKGTWAIQAGKGLLLFFPSFWNVPRMLLRVPFESRA